MLLEKVSNIVNQAPPSVAIATFAMYYVYMLTCFDGKPYIGCTGDLKDRIVRHNNGQVPATKDRLPVKRNELTKHLMLFDKIEKLQKSK